MRLRIVAILATLWFLPGQSAINAQQVKDTGTLQVNVTDPFGVELKRPTLELWSINGTRIAGGEGLHEFKNIPFGEYTLIALGGCCKAERRVILNVPKLWMKLGIPMRFGDSEGFPGGYLIIRGVLRVQSGISAKHWVRARGVFLNFSREAQVDPVGRFSIAGLDMGTYEIDVFEGSTRVHSRTLEIDPKVSITRIVVEIP